MSGQPDIIERLHQAHGYLARAEVDQLRLYVALLALQRLSLDAAASTSLAAVLERLTGNIERTTGNRFRLARDAERCGVDVQFFNVEHFDTYSRAHKA
ncbi:hypothetical protein AWB71_04491 [Caballeronia peredens]|nr:hypothetical protein AWB71_04491 [Caballeronia peredens]